MRNKASVLLACFTVLALITSIFVSNSLNHNLVFAVQGQNQGQGDCDPGYVKKDESAPYEYDGTQVITSVQVKAGSDQSAGEECTELTQNGSNGCYEVTGLGTTHVTVVKVGSGSSCKDISHVEFYSNPQVSPSPDPSASPSPSVSPNPSPSASPSASPSVNPTPEPTPSPEASAEPSPDPSTEPSPSPEPSVEPSTSPDPSASPEESPQASPSSSPGTGGTEVSASASPQVQSTVATNDVLGATILADTGDAKTTLSLAILILGAVSLILSMYGYLKTGNKA